MEMFAKLGLSYVLMVSSMHPPLAKLSDEQIRALNATPFDGVAAEVIGLYDGSPLPAEAGLLEQCRHIGQLSTKAVWPRINGNRIIELGDQFKGKPWIKNPTYFQAIRGWDLDGRAGALSDFYSLVRVGLRAARLMHAPGIVLDLESYNHSQGYRVHWIAERQGRTPAEVIERLKAVGRQVADIAAEEFPDAVFWSLFTTLDKPNGFREKDGPYYIAPAYVFMGLLEQAQQKRLPLVLVSGGEWGGYCYKSVEAMHKRFAARNEGFRPWLEKYPKNLTLAATITVWGDARNNRGWVLKHAGPDTAWRTTADFEPLLAEMFRTYRYNWVYVPSITDYRPLEAEKAAPINAELDKLLRRARKEVGN